MVRLVNGIPRYSVDEYLRMQDLSRNFGTKQSKTPDIKPANKYHAEKVIIDGIVFASKLEGRRYEQLKLMLYGGLIEWFHCQPSFVLPGGVRYRPDFIVRDMQGLIWVEDTKGRDTKDFVIKRKLFEQCYRGLELRIIR